MPWLKGRRPSWLIRLGLFLYDHMGGREILPGTRTLNLAKDPAGSPLQAKFRKAFEYSDCWIEDSRLVVLNARDAQDRGADILTRTKVLRTVREPDHWRITLQNEEGTLEVRARMLVNAGGPWVGDIIRGVVQSNSTEDVRLVRGSHIVTRKLFDHGRCYFFQGADGRIIFAIPYEQDLTLIGTTEAEHSDPNVRPVCTDEERDYLLRFASEYFSTPVTQKDIVWTYSGVRPLYDDGSSSATAATRDYVLTVDEETGAPLLNVFGGKITTYRKLAEAALEKIAPRLGCGQGAWTAGIPLPGGDFPQDGFDDLVDRLRQSHPFLTESWAHRLARAYGTDAFELLQGAREEGDLGKDFGNTITERELIWSTEQEFTRTAEDFLWRRTKLGLRVSSSSVEKVDRFLTALRAGGTPDQAHDSSPMSSVSGN
ncbi:glycerol-3-phosphate dehydrogenase [Sulfitobacter sediminis]|uniref:glycerol-3-phosphate dehydrogenase n=1 Tax=Sulfitobacter sediminis TaxID=3234186 RepID=UPI003B21DF03